MAAMGAAGVLIPYNSQSSITPIDFPTSRGTTSLSTSASACCCTSGHVTIDWNQRGRMDRLGQRFTSGRYGSGHRERRPQETLQRGCTVMRFGGGKEKNGEEKPETLFMKELARRGKLGQDPATLGTDTKTKEGESEKTQAADGSSSSSSSTRPKWTDEREKSDQRQRSMSLNSEGLDGLIPRGQELIKLGGSFWLSFWPLIVASLLAFVASYLYFGSSFVHSGNRSAPPPYVDPFQLLESEELPPGIGPDRVPYNTYRAPQQ